MTAPEQECQEGYDAKDERSDYHSSYGRSVDAGGVRLQGGVCLRGRRGRTRWSNISIVRNLSYGFSVSCQHRPTTEDRGRYARSKRLDRKIANLREKDITWKECLENTKLVNHAPKSESQNSRVNGKPTNVRSVKGECVVENRVHVYHHCLCKCLIPGGSL